MTRVRRSPEQARKHILDAAEQLLVEGGPQAVAVRAVAERAQMTDMGVLHHFGSRDELLAQLLHHVAAKFRAAMDELAVRWRAEGACLGDLVELLSAAYRAGHGRLALALHETGVRERGRPMLGPIVDALHEARLRHGDKGADLQDTRLAVAALHQALALEPLVGAEFRRSVGISANEAKKRSAQRQWWLTTLSVRLGIPAWPDHTG